jgi:hypothetical protein
VCIKLLLITQGLEVWLNGQGNNSRGAVSQVVFESVGIDSHLVERGKLSWNEFLF